MNMPKYIARIDDAPDVSSDMEPLMNESKIPMEEPSSATITSMIVADSSTLYSDHCICR